MYMIPLYRTFYLYFQTKGIAKHSQSEIVWRFVTQREYVTLASLHSAVLLHEGM